jgi:hypothetical protein
LTFYWNSRKQIFGLLLSSLRAWQVA